MENPRITIAIPPHSISISATNNRSNVFYGHAVNKYPPLLTAIGDLLVDDGTFQDTSWGEEKESNHIQSQAKKHLNNKDCHHTMAVRVFSEPLERLVT